MVDIKVDIMHSYCSLNLFVDIYVFSCDFALSAMFFFVLGSMHLLSSSLTTSLKPEKKS